MAMEYEKDLYHTQAIGLNVIFLYVRLWVYKSGFKSGQLLNILQDKEFVLRVWIYINAVAEEELKV